MLRCLTPFKFPAFVLALAACASTSDQDNDRGERVATGNIEHERYRCDLVDDIVSAGMAPGATRSTQRPINFESVSPFVLVRLSRAKEPNRFGYVTSSGGTVGIGQKQNDGRWSISSWAPSPSRGGPDVSLVTFFPDKRILVSFWTRPKAHVTYAGACSKI